MKKGTNAPDKVYINKDAKYGQKRPVLHHEASHIVDELVGMLRTDDIKDELSDIYRHQVKLRGREDIPLTPDAIGYDAENTPREYATEAIRLYLEAPDVMNKYYPKTARRIREAVRNNDKLNKFIHFNSLSALSLTGLGATEDYFNEQYQILPTSNTTKQEDTK